MHIGYNSGEDANLGRVSSLADDSSGSPGTHLAEYTYLGIGMVAKVDYTEPDLHCDLAHGSGDDPFDGLDRFDRVIDLLWRDYGASVDVERVTHGYDRAGNRLWRECPVPAAQNPAVHMDELYTYDGVYQLKTFKRGDLNATKDGIVSGTLKFAQEWSFDPTGNWTTFKEDAAGDGTFELDQSRTHSKFNEITQIAGSSTHVAHDRAGNMTKTPKADNWNASHDNVYDAWNRLVTVKDGAHKVIDNAHDALTRHILKKVYASGVLDYTRHYLYSDSWQIMEERKDSATRADRQFVWGRRYIDDLVLRDRDADAAAATGALGVAGSGLEERLYCLHDANWNVTALADANGDLTERFIFGAYGTPTFLTSAYTIRSTSSYDWETLFAGYRWHVNTGLYTVRRRQLVPQLGRWTTRDSLFHVSTSLYAYAGSSPVTRLDPTGAKDCCCCVNDADIEDLAIHRDLFGEGDMAVERWGHRFKLVTQLTYFEEGKGDCRIEWFECSTDASALTTEADVVHTKWHDSYKLFKDKIDGFDDWIKYERGEPPFDKRCCGSSFFVTALDTPMTPRYASRHLRILIRLSSAPKCKCEYKVIVIRLFQQLISKSMATVGDLPPIKPIIDDRYPHVHDNLKEGEKWEMDILYRDFKDGLEPAKCGPLPA